MMTDPNGEPVQEPAEEPAEEATLLDPLTLPLRGSRLIEASAGTGKTWTIAALYLRFVLGHGAADTCPPNSVLTGSPALAPSEILVMTFTRAATRELSERIRLRLQEAALCFRGEAEPAPHDQFLQDLMADYPEGAPRQAAAWRLALAAESMDDAAVHTIDAWCQRVLREHAFDSAQRFDEELLADEAELRQAAVHDVWRREIYPLHGAVLDLLLAVFPTVDAMASTLQPLLALDAAELRRSREHLLSPQRLGAVALHVQAEIQRRLSELKVGWPGRVDEMHRWLDTLHEAKAFDGRRLRPQYYQPWLAKLRTWAEAPDQIDLDLGTGAITLMPDGLYGVANGKVPYDVPAVFGDLQDLLAALPQLPLVKEAVMCQAALTVQSRLTELKRRQGVFGFSDLQVRLDAALSGPQGAVLRERIRRETPVALIDEFQDTSPLQYRLFDRLYGVASNDVATTLLLIGDPKQAIYSFRGADIYSYLRARSATAGRHHVLGTNFRSTQAMVEAVNTVFGEAEQRWPGGAFDLAKRSALALPFEAVAARSRPERWVVGAQPQPALSLQLLPEPLKAEEVLTQLSRHAAAQIVAWLNDPQTGFQRDGDERNGGEGDGEGRNTARASFQRLRPGDVAVLVRSRREANAVRMALRRRGVASVYLSDQESVFQSPEAQDLLRWLQAVANPLDAQTVRAAYATRLAGLSLAQMAALAHDETAWEARVSLLQRLHGVWQRHGVLTVLRQTLHALDLPARSLGALEEGEALPDGHAAFSAGSERSLTNLLHLGELLQQAAARLEGEQAQIRWLSDQILQSGLGVSDEKVVRLESDAQLVQVVTVHKSKGLEYPVVCLPFGSSFRPVTRKQRSHVARVDAATLDATPTDADADVGARLLDFRMDKPAVDEADRERLREDLRLLYVALTRARHAVWLGVGLPKSGGGRYGGKATPKSAGKCDLHRSALGYLLAGGVAMEADGVEQALAAWAERSSQVQVKRLVRPPSQALVQAWLAPAPLASAPEEPAGFDRQWRIGSFSGLVRDLAAAEGAGVDAAFDAPSQAAAQLTQPGAVDAVRQERLQELMASTHTEWPDDASGAAVGADLAQRPVSARRGSADDASAGPPWHRFERGPLAGNFLHELLQTLAEEGFDSIDTPAMHTRLRRRCERDGRADDADGVISWLQALLHTPLAGVGQPLVSLQHLLPEMEFWMPSVALRSAALDRICHRHCWPGQPRPALVPRELQGQLMGFADLVLEHEGRFWVMDYKSNALAPASASAEDADAAYHADALRDAMLHHRYELQAALYLLALHRLLRTRLGDAYDQAQHLGGAVYLFLRGFQGAEAGCVVLPASVAMLEELEQALNEADAPDLASSDTASPDLDPPDPRTFAAEPLDAEWAVTTEDVAQADAGDLTR